MVFLDTVGLLATWDEDDQWHKDAAHAFAQLAGERVIFVSTPHVFLECANAASRKTYRREVAELWQTMQQDESIISPDSDDMRAAWETYHSSHIGSPGVVDLLSFAVMRDLGINEAFTNDRLFSAAGFDLLF